MKSQILLINVRLLHTESGRPESANVLPETIQNFILGKMFKFRQGL